MIPAVVSDLVTEALMRLGTRIVVFLAAVWLGGCSSVPDFELPNGYRGVTVKQIVDKIDCEISYAKNDRDQIALRSDDPRNLNNWIAAVISDVASG